VDPFVGALPGPVGGQPPLEVAGPGRELVEELGADRQQVAAAEPLDLVGLAEARTHHLGRVAELLVVLVDPRHRGDAGVLVDRDVGEAALLLPVVVDPADEGRDQRDPGLRAGDRLGEAEQQRQVAVDPLALEDLGGADAFPGAGDLDQHAVPGAAVRLVERDQAAGLGQRRLGVEAQPRVDLGRDPAGHDVEDRVAERDEEPIEGILGVARRAERGLDQRRVRRIGGRLQDQRRVGRRVLRAVFLDRGDVAGVGDDHGVLLQGFEVVHGSGFRPGRW
jgi:hypothetical protein